MNLIKMTLLSLTTNWKTSAAAGVYLFAKFIIPILSIWFPELTPKLNATASTLESAAVGLGLLAAGDANKSAKTGDITQINATLKTHEDAIKSGDSTMLTKPKDESIK